MPTTETLIHTQANALINRCMAEITQAFKERALAFFKIGSTGGHGDFSICSDIDFAFMLDEVRPEDHKIVNEIWDRMKSSGLPFAEDVSFFWSSYDVNSFVKGVGRFPAIARWELIQNGILISGQDRRHALPTPTYLDLVINYAKYMLKYIAEEKTDEFTKYQESILKKGSSNFGRMILTPVRLLLTLDTGLIGSNKDAVEHFNQKYGKLMPETVLLVNQAYQSRSRDPNARVDIQLRGWKMTLLELYRFCLQQYHQMVSTTANANLIQQIEDSIKRFDLMLNEKPMPYKGKIFPPLEMINQKKKDSTAILKASL